MLVVAFRVKWTLGWPRLPYGTVLAGRPPPKPHARARDERHRQTCQTYLIYCPPNRLRRACDGLPSLRPAPLLLICSAHPRVAHCKRERRAAMPPVFGQAQAVAIFCWTPHKARQTQQQRSPPDPVSVSSHACAVGFEYRTAQSLAVAEVHIRQQLTWRQRSSHRRVSSGRCATTSRRWPPRSP
ncbi:hypothetical protein T492DRAFT_367863 [Pavlovales sp. CCMP2436]|nr:hypothetical protein T492DRAFT_367863 [Pavlovales sp. CCMP2436]